MRTTVILSAVLIFLYGPTFSQVKDKPFPEMKTLTLEAQTIYLPKDSKGKFTLLGMAFSKKSENALNSWFQPIYDKFLSAGTGDMGSMFGGFGYDVNVYFVPMFTGVKTAATKTAMKKAIKHIHPSMQKYILFYKGKLKPYKNSLNFEERDVPYFFVLDEKGIIRYATSGTYTNAKMTQIEAVLE